MKFTNYTCTACSKQIGVPDTVKEVPCQHCGRPFTNPDYRKTLEDAYDQPQPLEKSRTSAGSQAPRTNIRVTSKQPLFEKPDYSAMSVKSLLEHKELLDKALLDKKLQLAEQLELLDNL